jgi:hypothetical protein
VEDWTSGLTPIPMSDQMRRCWAYNQARMLAVASGSEGNKVTTRDLEMFAIRIDRFIASGRFDEIVVDDPEVSKTW